MTCSFRFSRSCKLRGSFISSPAYCSRPFRILFIFISHDKGIKNYSIQQSFHSLFDSSSSFVSSKPNSKELHPSLKLKNGIKIEKVRRGTNRREEGESNEMRKEMGDTSINKRRSPATQIVPLLSPFAILWPVSSVRLLLFLLSFFPPLPLLLLSPLLVVAGPNSNSLSLSLSLLDIQTNKLGGPPGPGPRMNHLKQWNAD